MNPRRRSKIRATIRSKIDAFLVPRGFELVKTEKHRFLRPAAPVSKGSGKPVHDLRLEELRARYRTSPFGRPPGDHSFWTEGRVASYVDLASFRSHSLYLWQYAERPRVTELKYFAYLAHLEPRDHAGLLTRTSEDGAFGAPVFEFPDRVPLSRDVLDSVNEILFLDRQLDLLTRPEVRIADIGAGYGRLAHRMSELVPGLVDYACFDAVPESTYLCERYLAHRAISPPCRVVELPDAPAALAEGGFDLAVNVHSFSEMSYAAVREWLEALAAAGIPKLFVVPNEPDGIRSVEPDHSRRDLAPLFAELGFELVHREPTITDPAAQALFGVADHFHLYART